MKKKYSYAFLILVIALFFSSCGENQSLTPPEVETNILKFGTDHTLDIVTWNLREFPWKDETIDLLVEIISQMEVEVFALQEIMEPYKLHELASRLPDYEALVYNAGTSWCLGYLYDASKVELINEFTIYAGMGRPFPRPPYVLRMDFEDEDAETDARNILDLTDYFQVTLAGPSPVAKVVEDGDNKYLSLQGYMEFFTYDLIEAPYTFSVDVQLVDTENIAFFVRSYEPITKFNPAHGGGKDDRIGYFEADWYKENGGQNCDTSQGSSGIMVMPRADALRVAIKTYETDGINIGHRFYDFPYPEGIDISKFFNLKFVDDGEKVEIYLNNEKISTVTMSDPGTYDEELSYEEENYTYYKTAVIHDAEGNEALKVENSRLNPESSQLAIGIRDKAVNIDNLAFTYEFEPTPTPDPTPTPSPTEEVKETEKPATTTAAKSDKTSGDSNMGIIIGIIGAAVVVCVVIILLAVRATKKK